MNNIKIKKLMKVRFDIIANRIGQLSKSESESLLLEHLEWLEGGWETEEILFLKKPTENGGSKSINNGLRDQDQILFYKNFLEISQQIILLFVWHQIAQNLKLCNHK